MYLIPHLPIRKKYPEKPSTPCTKPINYLIYSLWQVYGLKLKPYTCDDLQLACPEIGSFSTDLWRRLGIAQASLASALALHKRSFSTDVFFTFSAALGKVQVNLPSALACTKIGCGSA